MQENERRKPSLHYWEWGICGGWCRELKGATFTRLTDAVGALSLLKASHSSAPVRATEKLRKQTATTLYHIFS